MGLKEEMRWAEEVKSQKLKEEAEKENDLQEKLKREKEEKEKIKQEEARKRKAEEEAQKLEELEKMALDKLKQQKEIDESTKQMPRWKREKLQRDVQRKSPKQEEKVSTTIEVGNKSKELETGDLRTGINLSNLISQAKEIKIQYLDTKNAFNTDNGNKIKSFELEIDESLLDEINQGKKAFETEEVSKNETELKSIFQETANKSNQVERRKKSEEEKSLIKKLEQEAFEKMQILKEKERKEKEQQAKEERIKEQ